jgi:hypothetical protein
LGAPCYEKVNRVLAVTAVLLLFLYLLRILLRALDGTGSSRDGKGTLTLVRE